MKIKTYKPIWRTTYTDEDIQACMEECKDGSWINKNDLIIFLSARLKEIAREKATTSMSGGQKMHRLRGIQKELENLMRVVNNGNKL